MISTHNYRVIILVINLSLRFISLLGRFPEDFLQGRTPFMGVLYATPFHSLSIYPLHLSLSLPISLLSLPPSLYLSLPLYISPSTFLSLSLLLSFFSLSFSLAYLMDVFVLVISIMIVLLS